MQAGSREVQSGAKKDELSAYTDFTTMLSFALPEPNDYNYLVLADSILSYIVKPETLQNFLRTSQSGSAHMSYGTDIGILLKHILTTIVLCVIELTLFCYLRTIFKHIYLPRCYCTPNSERMVAPPQGFFEWIWSSWNYDSNYFLSMGLDTYFFLRFLNILLIFFTCCGALNMLVLIPVNYTSSSPEFTASGLDKLSISNLALSKARMLNFHFICTIITIVFFNLIIFNEFKCIARIRQSYLNSQIHRERDYSRVLLLGNIPETLRSPDALRKLFQFCPGGLQSVWLCDDYHKFWWAVEKAEDALDILEKRQVSILKHCKPDMGNFYKLMDAKFYPPIYSPIYVIPYLHRHFCWRFPGFIRVLAWQKQLEIRDYCISTIADTLELILNRMKLLAQGTYQKQDKAFLMFSSQESAYMAHQLLLSLTHGALDESQIQVNPRDIVWANLARKSSILTLMEKHMICVIIVMLIFLYVIPVSLIALFSQVPLITQLFPFLQFLAKLPEEIRLTFSSLLPTVLLSILTTAQLKMFRSLLFLKGTWSYAEVELDLQKWYFAFLFIQQFLVVSLLTSVIMILIQVVEKPVSVPLLLAMNIPKSSVFFCKYLSVKAFSLCGNNFLRFNDLVLSLFVYRWTDSTPRQKFKRLSTLKRVRWGLLYSTISVYGAIGITYCVISPVVSVFIVIILLLTLLYYKHALHYVYSHVNESETHGKFYPRALFHLYVGVYCLEFCMIGMFAYLRDSRGNCPMKVQTIMLVIALICTVSGNIVAHRKFKKYFEQFPQMNDEDTAVPEEELSGNSNDERAGYYNSSLRYFHPCYAFRKPVLWVPEDEPRFCEKILAVFAPLNSALAGASSHGATINLRSWTTSITLTNEPPCK